MGRIKQGMGGRGQSPMGSFWDAYCTTIIICYTTIKLSSIIKKDLSFQLFDRGLFSTETFFLEDFFLRGFFPRRFHRIFFFWRKYFRTPFLLVSLSCCSLLFARCLLLFVRYVLQVTFCLLLFARYFLLVIFSAFALVYLLNVTFFFIILLTFPISFSLFIFNCTFVALVPLDMIAFFRIFVNTRYILFFSLFYCEIRYKHKIKTIFHYFSEALYFKLLDLFFLIFEYHKRLILQCTLFF